MKSSITQVAGMTFDFHVRDHSTRMDVAKLIGGQDSAPTPKELLGASIMGCTAMDVVALLKKHKIAYQNLSMDFEAELTDTHPKVFKEILLTYKLVGAEAANAREKLIEAVDLSMTKFCGVSAMISKAVTIKYKVLIDGEEIHQGTAKF